MSGVPRSLFYVTECEDYALAHGSVQSIGHSRVHDMPGGASSHGSLCFQTYLSRPSHPCYQLAVPSLGREKVLCEQTLTVLRKYKWKMCNVHVFVDALRRRDDGSCEYDNYVRHLKAHGFVEVQIHPGGDSLGAQYARIFDFFRDVPGLCVASDTVSSLQWRRLTGSIATEELPDDYMIPLVSLMFEQSRSAGFTTWSLAPCKSGRNMQPGHMSYKCGLLDGNFFGVCMDRGEPVKLQGSHYTTDVEFSVRTWLKDGGFVRFLGVSAMHAYRSAGGHAASEMIQSRRVADTNAAIQSLARQFPTLIRYNSAKTSVKAMMYTFLAKGGRPVMVKHLYNARGRKPEHAARALSAAQRQRRCRQRRQVPV